MSVASLKEIYIGNIIRNAVDVSGMTYAEFARRIHCSRPSLYGLFNSKSIDIEKLILISNVLQFDFFHEIYGIGSNTGIRNPFLAIPYIDGKLNFDGLSDDCIRQIKTSLLERYGSDETDTEK